MVIEGELTGKDPFDKIRKGSRVKVHDLELKAEEIYLIDLRSLDFDTFLRLEDSTGKKISENDDISATNLNSRLGFMPKKTGTYRAVVTTYDPGLTGRYTVYVGTLKKAGESQIIEGTLTDKSPKAVGRHYEVKKIAFKTDEFWLIDVNSKDFNPYLNVTFMKKTFAWDAYAGKAMNSRLVVAIGDPGEYLLHATALKAGAMGAYTMSLHRLERTSITGFALEERWEQEVEKLKRRGVALMNTGRIAEAAREFKSAVELREKLYPKDKYPDGHPALALGLIYLGKAYHDMGDYGQAEPLFQQALKIFRNSKGEQHPGTAIALTILATNYAEQANFAKAEPLAEEGLEMTRKLVGEKHPDFARDLNNLAYLYHLQGKNVKAEPLFRQVLELIRETHGERDDYASCLNNLANLYYAERNFAKAEPFFRQVLEIRRRLFGEKHLTVADSLHNLASLYLEQGDHAKAEPLFTQALEIKRSELGEKHPRLAVSLGSMAKLRFSQGQANEAELLGRQAAQITGLHLDATAAVQTEQGQVAFLSKRRNYLNLYLSFSKAADTLATDAYAIVLPWKGAVTNRQRMTRFTRSSLTDADKDTAAVFANLDDVSRQYATLVNRPINPKTTPDFAQATASTHRRTGTARSRTSQSHQSVSQTAGSEADDAGRSAESVASGDGTCRFSDLSKDRAEEEAGREPGRLRGDAEEDRTHRTGRKRTVHHRN